MAKYRRLLLAGILAVFAAAAAFLFLEQNEKRPVALSGVGLDYEAEARWSAAINNPRRSGEGKKGPD